MSRVLLTGANGFLGSALLKQLQKHDRYRLVVALRHSMELSGCERIHQISGLAADTGWSAALTGVDIVIHTAARVHVMEDTASDPLAEFRKVNVEGTLALARQAVAAGVSRFIFISSIKVNGEETSAGHPFQADDVPCPIDPYGISKCEAESELKVLAAETGMEVVIIRPVLVYGPGVRANFRSMMRWLNTGIPLPLGSIDNRRSLVYLGNLVDLILTCMEHPAAANQTFLASDGEDLSTTQLLKRLGVALRRPARLIPVPVGVLKLGVGLLGKKLIAQRLCSSLQVNINKNKELLGWTPPVTLDDALRITAQDYQDTRSY